MHVAGRTNAAVHAGKAGSGRPSLVAAFSAVFLSLMLASALGDVQTASLSGVAIYNKDEIQDERDWFGMWHIRPAFGRLGVTYEQTSYQEYDQHKVYDVYVCYLVDEKLREFGKLFSILHRAYSLKKKVILLGNLAAYFQDVEQGYNTYNRILNFAGVEDRANWSDTLVNPQISVDSSYYNPEVTAAHVRNLITYSRSMYPFTDTYKAIVSVNTTQGLFAPVAITPYGGLAINPFIIKRIGGQWILALNLDRFFQDVIEYPSVDFDTKLHGQVDRKALVVFSAEEQDYRNNIFRTVLQLPLNLLGYDFDYLDLAVKKDLDSYSDYPIVIVVSPRPQSRFHEEFLRFITLSKARKYIFVGYLPFFNLQGEAPYWDLALKLQNRFNFTFKGYDTLGANRTVTADPRYYPFETELTSQATRYGKITSLSVDRKPVISITDPQSTTYTPVFYDAQVLFLIGDFLTDANNQYYLNFFDLLRDFLNPRVIPLFQFGYGTRIAISHVDGDGFTNSRQPRPDVLAGERIYQLLQELDLPVSVSYIVSDILPEYTGRVYTLHLAKRIIDLPNVELASHTLTHPYQWNPAKQPDERYVKQGYSIVPVDSMAEIVTSVELLQDHLAENVELLFWSGDTSPTEEQLRLAREHGIININGGDTILDDQHAGYYWVTPPYAKIGNEVQVHAGAANENIYTNLWTGPFDGYRNVIRTFQQTGARYVTGPIDVYYHFYSGAHTEAFLALQDVYTWVRRQEISPMFTGDYVRLVNDWIDMKLYDEGNSLLIHNSGHLMSVRIMKSADTGAVDLSRSWNVVGYAEGTDSFDVFLDQKTVHRIAFSATQVENGPYICQSSHPCEIIWSTAGERVYKFHGNGPFRVDLCGLKPDQLYEVQIHTDEGQVRSEEHTTDGHLRVTDELAGGLVFRLRARNDRSEISND